MHSNRGFSIIEVLVVIVVVAIIGSGGYLLWQKYYPSNGTTTSPKSTKTQTSTQVERFFYTSADANGDNTKLYEASVSDYTPHLIDISTIAVDTLGRKFEMSPDGRYVAIESKGAIYVYAVKGLDITKPTTTISSSSEKYTDLIWSADSQRIAYVGRSNIQVDPDSGAELATVKIYSATAKNQDVQTVKSIDQTNGVFVFAVSSNSVYWTGAVDGGFWTGVNMSNSKTGVSQIVFDPSSLSADVLALTVKFNVDLSIAYGADRDGNLVKIPASGSASILKKVASDDLYYSSFNLTPDGKSMLAQLMTLTQDPTDTTNKVVKIDLATGDETVAYDATVHKVARTFDQTLSPEGDYLWMAGNSWYQTLRLKDGVATTTYNSTQTGTQMTFIGWTESY